MVNSSSNRRPSLSRRRMSGLFQRIRGNKGGKAGESSVTEREAAGGGRGGGVKEAAEPAAVEATSTISIDSTPGESKVSRQPLSPEQRIRLSLTEKAADDSFTKDNSTSTASSSCIDHDDPVVVNEAIEEAIEKTANVGRVAEDSVDRETGLNSNNDDSSVEQQRTTSRSLTGVVSSKDEPIASSEIVSEDNAAVAELNLDTTSSNQSFEGGGAAHLPDKAGSSSGDSPDGAREEISARDNTTDAPAVDITSSPKSFEGGSSRHLDEGGDFVPPLDVTSSPQSLEGDKVRQTEEEEVITPTYRPPSPPPPPSRIWEQEQKEEELDHSTNEEDDPLILLLTSDDESSDSDNSDDDGGVASDSFSSADALNGSFTSEYSPPPRKKDSSKARKDKKSEAKKKKKDKKEKKKRKKKMAHKKKSITHESGLSLVPELGEEGEEDEGNKPDERPRQRDQRKQHRRKLSVGGNDNQMYGHKLYRLLNHDPWNRATLYNDDEVIAFIGAHPESCRTKYRFEGFSGDIYPLSMLCSLGPSLDAVKACHRAHPAAAEEKDIWVGTPLHYACSYRADLSVIKYLCKANPDALVQTNRTGRTPLHMACCSSFNGASLPDAVSLLLKKGPEAAQRADRDGYTPLHLACDNNRAPDVAIEALVKAFGEACVKRTKYGAKTPVHLAVGQRAPYPLVKRLVKGQQEFALSVADDEGQLPLHVAVVTVLQAGGGGADCYDSVDDRKTIKLLVKKFPGALEIQNIRGETPLDVAHRLCDDPDPHLLQVLTPLM